MDKLPNHVAIIPDGNRRWAKEKNKLSYQGHQYAAEKILPQLIDKLQQMGVKYFTFWALSTENLNNRSKEEIDNLLNLMRFFIKTKTSELDKKNIKIKFIGNIIKLPLDIQKSIKSFIKKTEKNTAMTVVLAINYGGRDEILRAIKKIKNLENRKFRDLLDTSGIPDPDLIIRTGGEKRLSGFMLWQSEYSELFFSNLYFPDFTAYELEKVISDYLLRQRRFGR